MGSDFSAAEVAELCKEANLYASCEPKQLPDFIGSVYSEVAKLRGSKFTLASEHRRGYLASEPTKRD